MVVQAFCGGADDCDQEQENFVDTKIFLHPGDIVRLDLLAGDMVAPAGVLTLPNFSGAASAEADPQIFIDPSFPFANDVELIFSSNLFTSGLPPEAVPEPASGLLLAAGLGLLAAVLRGVRAPL